MEKIIFYTIKRVQEYWHTLSCYLKAGCSSFFWTNAFSKKLFFCASLLLLGFGFTPNSYGQLVVGEGGVKANFGVDGDAYANFIGFSIVDPPLVAPPSFPPSNPGADFMNTDDWFQRLTGEDPISWPGSGRGVIDQTNDGILPTDPEGTLPHDLGDIRQQILGNSNYAFQKRQAVPPQTIVNTNGTDYLWLDAVYGRDYNVVGIKGDAVDKSWFTSGADKNADNPSGWTLGNGSGGPQKDDIIDAMAHLRGIGPKPPTELDPRPFTTLWAFGAATLRSTSGDKHIDFEFFRTLAKFDGTLNKIVNTGADGGRTAFTFYTADDPLTPVEEIVGDVDRPGTILVSIDYSGGGRVPGVEIRVWMEESVFNNFDNSADGRPFNVVPGTFVKGTDSGNFGYGLIIEKEAGATPHIFGRVNVEGSTPASPWGTLEGEGADFSDEYGALQHVEIGINLTAFGLDKKGDEGPCADILGSLLVKTRSSGGSLTSELKDFVGPFPFGNTVDPPVITPTDFAVCANVDDDQTFNLNDRITVTGSGTITFHTTEADRDAGTNAIPAADVLAYPVPIADSPKTIWVRGSTTAPGCFGEAQFILTVNPLPTADAGDDDSVCYDGGTNTMQLDGSASGGTSPYSYEWSGDITYLSATNIANPTYDNAPVGTYNLTLTVTDDSGCQDTDTVQLVVDPNPTADAGDDDSVCYDGGTNTMQLDGSASGGTSPYSYAWSGDTSYLSATNIANPTYDNAPVGTYNLTLTVTDANGCQDTDTVQLVVDPNPTADAGDDDSVCYDGGTNTMQLDGSASGGTSPYSYAWSGDTSYLSATNIANPTHNNAPVGTYNLTLTVTDANGCQDTDTVQLVVDPNPTADAGDDDSVCYDGGTNTMQLDGSASGGTSPYSYAWSGDTSYLSATNIANPTHDNAPVGTYNLTLTVTDANGCQDTDTVQLVVDPNPTADAGDDDSVCYDGGTNTMQLDGSASGGTSPYSYAWSGDTSYLSATNIANPTYDNAPVGTYNLTLTVTDASGCQDTDTVQLVVDPNPTADAGDDDSVCYDGGTNTMQLDGSASGGTSPYSYAWSGDTSYLSATNIANPTHNNAPVGTYNLTLTVTDANGCQDTDTVQLVVDPNPTADAGDDDSVCYDGGTNTMQLDGSASGGTSPYNYAWSGDTSYLSATNIANPTHNNAPVGTYNLTLTVTDANGCQDTDTVQLVVDPNPTADAGDDDSVCYDGGTNTMQLDGSASGGTSPYSYAWSGDTSYLSATNIANPTHNNAPVGTYNLTLTVTDANGCQDTDTVQLVVDPNPTADAGDDDSVCYDGGTNTMQLDGSASGGTSPYSYAWSGDTSYLSATNIANPTHNNAPVGTYNLTLTVTDANGCQDTDTVQLVVDPNPTADAGDDDSVCYDGGTNTIQLDGSASGGTSPYSYAWSGDTSYLSATNIANPTHNNAPVGTYNLTLTVTDANGCQDTDTVQLVVNPNPECSITGEQTICSGSSSTFTATAGMASYSWTGPVGFTPATTQSITVSIAGIYEVTITDANGCSSKCTRELIVENCGYGCTPGFWQGGKGKQLWDGVGKDPVGDKVGFTTNTSFYDVFTGVTPGSCSIPSSLTMIDAITLGGGNCRKLVRHGVAGVLNAATLEGYPLPVGITSIQGLIDAIEAAINNSCGCEPLASEIAANNELNHDLCGTISEDALDLLISNVSTSKLIDAKSSDTSFDAYPVPFKDQLTIKYKFDYTSDVKIEVFSLQGVLVFSTTDNNSYLNKEVVLNLAIPREQEQLYVVKLTTNRGSSIKKVLSSVKN